jgi:hypothetical protein
MFLQVSSFLALFFRFSDSLSREKKGILIWKTAKTKELGATEAF